jgi:hypothetical protein
LLATPEPHPQRCHAEQVRNDNGKIEEMDAHRVSSVAPFECCGKVRRE